LIAIILYISYAFRKVTNGPVPSWVFGIGAIVALIHDILVVVGVFVILGKFAGVQIDSLFVTALLTILGFSVHDTIVVYDRVREGLKDRAKKTFKEIVNESINTTLARSLNTSISTLLVLLALYLFGGASIQYFVLALIIGIISGTYSSIFIASPLLLLGQRLLKR
ncbi:MAG: protein translocase subunit SecF, partial [Candidatus Kerfeldbacteria bacterium CG15_BIG_FIL_POST_REV_8_21_14_020_45_12]